jgi:hypothetical protein
MNVGNKVVHINTVGTIVGVSTAGNPVVEWDEGTYEEEITEDLIVVELPSPTDELDPAKEVINDD